MSARAEFAKTLRGLAARYGFEVAQTNGGHTRLTDPTTGQVIFAAGSPSDRRAVRNVEAKMRRLRKSREPCKSATTIPPRTG